MFDSRGGESGGTMVLGDEDWVREAPAWLDAVVWDCDPDLVRGPTVVADATLLPELGWHPADAPDTALTRAALLDRIGDQEAALARAAARQLATIYELSRREDPRPGDWCADELMFLLNISQAEAHRRLTAAEELHTRLPVTRQALAEGRISLAHVQAVVGVLVHAGDETARVVDEGLRETLSRRLLPGDLARAAARRALRVDPQFRRDQQRRVRAARSLYAFDSPDGLGHLDVVLPRADHAAVLSAIDLHAQRCGPDDERTIDVRRADAFVTMVLNGAPVQAGAGAEPRVGAPRRPGVGVVMSWDTFRGAADDPVEMLGHGPVTAEDGRWLACDAPLFALLTDPATGRLADVRRMRGRPDERLRRLVLTRDRSCRFPGCAIPAERCAVHHIVFSSRGGPTTAGNLTALCAHHHHAVHDGEWRLRRNRDGTLTWTAPTGHSRTVTAPGLGPPG